MNLDEKQKQTVAGWIEQGLSLSEIQKRLASELGLSLRYMEVRFLLDDLKLQPKDPVSAPSPAAPFALAPESNAQAPQSKAKGEPGGKPLAKDKPAAPAGVSVTVDQITRPGALVSGQVTFSDGQTATWYLDQMGRLGLAPQQRGYKPTEPDVMEFQTLLQQELMKQGYA